MSPRPCRKTRYGDRLEALLALARIGTQDHVRAKAPHRAYCCQFCQGWHLTSQAEFSRRVS